MKELKIAVCDDESMARVMLMEGVKNFFKSQNIACSTEGFMNYAMLREEMMSQTYDLLILDIEMPGCNGIEFSKELRKMNDNTAIIFASNAENRVFETIPIHPFGFIRKSNFIQDTKNILEQYIKEYAKKPEEGGNLFLKIGNKVYRIFVRDIVYIESSGRNQFIYLSQQQKPIEVREGLSKLKDKLSLEECIMQVHKSFIVNMNYINLIGKDEILLDKKYKIPINYKKSAEIKEKYMLFCAKKRNLIRSV